jgi:hypothetical protein
VMSRIYIYPARVRSLEPVIFCTCARKHLPLRLHAFYILFVPSFPKNSPNPPFSYFISFGCQLNVFSFYYLIILMLHEFHILFVWKVP